MVIGKFMWLSMSVGGGHGLTGGVYSLRVKIRVTALFKVRIGQNNKSDWSIIGVGKFRSLVIGANATNRLRRGFLQAESVTDPV